MKVEIRCAGCGKGYLVEEAKLPLEGGFVACQACGATIVVHPRPIAAEQVDAPPAPAAPEAAAPAPAAMPGGPPGSIYWTIAGRPSGLWIPASMAFMVNARMAARCKSFWHRRRC